MSVRVRRRAGGGEGEEEGGGRSGGAKRVKMTRQEKKKMVKDELLSKKWQKKLLARVEKDDLPASLPSSICITLGRMAYDLARSGTAEQLSNFTDALPFLLPYEVEVVSDKSLQDSVSEAFLFGEAAYLMALSGVPLRTPLRRRHEANDDVSPNHILDLLVLLASSTLLQCHTSLQQPISDYVMEKILSMMDCFAIAGLGINDSLFNFHYLTKSIPECVTCNLKRKSPRNYELLLENALKRTELTSTKFNCNGFWLHSPCGSPLTTLWLHRYLILIRGIIQYTHRNCVLLINYIFNN